MLLVLRTERETDISRSSVLYLGYEPGSTRIPKSPAKGQK
jgi:hypothetical protein